MAGESSNPVPIAVVGAGPSGFYAAEALLKALGPAVRIDLFDRLPTPYGLVRGGVSPDHQKIKSVTAVYEKTALDPRVRFFGNVKLGRDVSADELRARYKQIVYAVGCESDRHMGVPGEDLAGSRSATEFVGWYNGHPDHHDRGFDLSCEAVAVVGIGNVALDVTRILSCDPETLAGTDIAGYALDALRKSRVKTVWLLGRRGPAEAAYSLPEIEEIGESSAADLIVDPRETSVDDVSLPELADAAVKKKLEYVQARAKEGPGAKPRQVRLRFRLSPVELIGENGRVAALRVEKNRLVPNGRGSVRPVGTGEFETLPVGLVLRSVGYRGIPIPGVPFDEPAGRIPNADGRVLSAPGGPPRPGEYAVGWIKRGPSGLIGTNRADAAAVVQLMVQDLKSGAVTAAAELSPDSMPNLLAQRRVRAISFADWKKLDALERSNGAAKGRVREKFTNVGDMLRALGGDATAGRAASA